MSNSSWSPKDIKPGGWLFIILILAGLFWFVVKPRLAHNAAGTTTATAPTNADTSNPMPIAASPGNVIFLTTKTNLPWIKQQVDEFNQTSPGFGIRVDTLATREAMQGIHNHTAQPTIFNPSTQLWLTRIGDLDHFVDNSSADYKVLFKSPLVILTTKKNLPMVRQIFQGNNAWDNVRQQSKFGKLRFSFADPINASSGTLTMSMMLREYAKRTGQTNLVATANSAGFKSFLKDLTSGWERANTQKSADLEKAYGQDQSNRDFITAYEAAAIKAVNDNSNLAFVYPNPTVDANQAAAVLKAPWVSAEQRKNAEQFLAFLSTPEQLAKAADFNFRPTINGAGELESRVKGPAASYFQTSYLSTETCPYAALNDAAAVWNGIR